LSRGIGNNLPNDHTQTNVYYRKDEMLLPGANLGRLR
jgi:hypothetical protein